MNPSPAAEYSLERLAEALASLLASAPSAADGRVSALPDARTLRYYQSTGLMDRPLRYDGRVALYGHRHLLQAAAVKLLQAQGYSLAQVQGALAGASTEALQAAVQEAAGQPAPLPAPPTAPRPLRAAQLAPGVTVLVDPSLVSDPEGLFALLSQTLNHAGVSSC